MYECTNMYEYENVFYMNCMENTKMFYGENVIYLFIYSYWFSYVIYATIYILINTIVNMYRL